MITTAKAFFGKLVFLQTLTPIEPFVQKYSVYFYAPRYLALLVKFGLFSEVINIARDAHVWNSKTRLKNPLLVKEEKLIKTFRNWYTQFYSPNSKNFADVYQGLEW